MEILKIQSLNKHYGGTKALSDINFRLEKGSIHSLLGRNGAGKSTLVNIIAGTLHQDSGTIHFGDSEISKLSVSERQKIGIRIVTQHAAVVDDLTVGENIFLGLWPEKKSGMVNWETLYDEAAVELEKYGLAVDPKIKAQELTPVDKRKLNIVRAMFGGAKLIILDEPTTSLTLKERESLFSFVRELSAKGTAFIFISHYLDEVMKLSDCITVLRDGRCQIENSYDKHDSKKLARLIAGEEIEELERVHPSFDGADIALECESVFGSLLKDVSFKLRMGEVLGIVGFSGSGARRICRALYGLNRIKSGEIKLHGKVVSPGAPSDALDEGICYVTNDRHSEGIVAEMSVKSNISLSVMKRELTKNGLISSVREKNLAQTYYKKLKIKVLSLDQVVGSLSGGNQQKVVVAKILSCKPKILILDEPTIGIDVLSREEILNIVDEISSTGVGVLYLTNDYDELLRISDRLLFFKDGKIIHDKKNENFRTEDVIYLRDN